jgi:hypothetical protein
VSFELHNVRGVPCTLVEPRPRKLNRMQHKWLKKRRQRESKGKEAGGGAGSAMVDDDAAVVKVYEARTAVAGEAAGGGGGRGGGGRGGGWGDGGKHNDVGDGDGGGSVRAARGPLPAGGHRRAVCAGADGVHPGKLAPVCRLLRGGGHAP